MSDQSQTTDCFGYPRWSPTSCRRCGYERQDCTCIGGFAAPESTDDRLERDHVIFPWRHADLIDWTIVGMNHYREDDGRKLFVAMTRAGHCIKAEGPDDGEVWFRLMAQARHFRSVRG